MNDLERQHNHFESIAKKYAACRKDEKHLLVKAAIWDDFFARLPIKSTQTLCVLEAMCGAADGYEMLQKYLPSSYTYEAFDYSEKMVEEAKTRLPNENIYCQDVTKFADNEKYDIIMIIGGLHHVYKHRKLVAHNVASALKKGGLFINFEPTHNNFFLRKIRERVYTKNAFFDEETERAFSTTELNTLMSDAGLHPSVQSYPGLLAYILWYNPDAFPALNIGTPYFVKKVLALEKHLWTSQVARYFSFATLSCFQK